MSIIEISCSLRLIVLGLDLMNIFTLQFGFANDSEKNTLKKNENQNNNVSIILT